MAFLPSSDSRKARECEVGPDLVPGKEVPGGLAPLGQGKREGPAGDKFLRSKDAGNGGRVRSGAKRNGAPRESPSRHNGDSSTPPCGLRSE